MKERTMVLPENSIIMQEEEQRSVVGGYHIAMQERFLNKSWCLTEASGLIQYYGLHNINQQQLAIEIYAHAYVFYYGKLLSFIPVKTVQNIYNSAANGIDFVDGLDSRQSYFELIWNYGPNPKA